MALIKCPECGKEISDTAKNCIHCGYVLKEETNVAPQQSIIGVSKKRKSSKNFLVAGITLHLCCLTVSTINAFLYAFNGDSTNSTNIIRTELIIKNLFIPSIVVAAISFICSLTLLAVPQIRKKVIVIPYLFVNLLSVAYMQCFLFEGCISLVTIVPHALALIVSFVLIIVSLFIKDEKE